MRRPGGSLLAARQASGRRTIGLWLWQLGDGGVPPLGPLPEGRRGHLWLSRNRLATLPAAPCGVDRWRTPGVERSGQKGPRRWRHSHQTARLGFGDLARREGSRRLGGKGLEAPAWPIHDDDGNHRPPTLPAMEAGQIVGTHDPNKADQRAASFQEGEGPCRIGSRQIALEGGDDNARTLGHCPAQHQPLGERREVAARLQGIAGGHQPPDLV